MQELSEQLTITYAELFQAISMLENHVFECDEEYFQQCAIQIESPHGYSCVKGLIQKRAETLIITLFNGAFIECADTHILFTETDPIYANQVQLGDFLKTKDGLVAVVDIHAGTHRIVYDVEVDNAEHQYYSANGILHHNTSITAVISHVYSQAGYRVITIVPSADLVDQTYDWYELLGLDVGRYAGDHKDLNHPNVVATWQALQYNPTIMRDFQCVIWDEAHGARADVAKKLINDNGSHIPFRFGVTGTFPKSESDQMALSSAIGPILRTIPASWLIENKYLADVEIEPIELNETYIDEDFPDYTAEKAFLSKSPARMSVIADLIISRCATHGNTLVLVNSIPFGEKLASLIKGAVFLYGESSKDLRKEHYQMFAGQDDLIVIATAGIASTGISIDRIFCLMLVDAGKSFIKAIQSVGRGLRMGHDKSKVHVCDVHSKQKWAKKHFKERLKNYNEASYPVAKKLTLKVK